MIEGLVQEVQYGNSASRLYWVSKLNGKEVTPDSAPTIAIYDTNGDALVSATSMTIVPIDTAGGRGYLDYDGQSAEFVVGDVLTGGTSGATATIERDAVNGTAGTLTLSNIFGTFQNNETITSTSSGSATANLAAYTREYYYVLDVSATGTYELGENYGAKIANTISSVVYNDWFYFDVVYHTFMDPIVTSAYIDEVHPDWKRLHPDGEQALWDRQIELGHAELARRIRSLGNRAAFMVKREELFMYELALIEAEIAKRLISMPAEERDFWIQQCENKWASRGEFAYDTYQEDSEIDEDVKVLSSGFTR